MFKGMLKRIHSLVDGGIRLLNSTLEEEFGIKLGSEEEKPKPKKSGVYRHYYRKPLRRRHRICHSRSKSRRRYGVSHYRKRG